MNSWLRRQYDDIKGHLKYELLRTVVLSLVGGTALALLYAFWQRLKQVPKDLYLLGGLFILSTAMFFYLANRLQAFRPIQRNQPPKPVPPSIPIDPKKPNLKCEIQEILFHVESLGIISNFHILLRVRVVNYGEQEVGVTKWSLIVEADRQEQADEEPIPRDWKIRRRAVGTGETVKQIDKKFADSTEPFRKGIPQVGWILFKLTILKAVHPPYSAKFTLKAKDALGEEHVAEFGPRFLEETGEISII